MQIRIIDVLGKTIAQYVVKNNLSILKTDLSIPPISTQVQVAEII